MKRILSIMLTIAIITNMSIGAFAAAPSNASSTKAPTVLGDVYTEEAVQKIFEARMRIVSEQLESQKALDMIDVYEPIIWAELEAEVQIGSGIAPLEDDIGHYLPDGGTVFYKQDRGAFPPQQMAIVGIHPDDSGPIIIDYLQASQSFSLKNLLVSGMGLVLNGTVGLLYNGIHTASSQLGSSISGSVTSSIQNADYYIKVIQSFNTMDNSITRVVTGWSSHDEINVPHGIVTDVIVVS